MSCAGFYVIVGFYPKCNEKSLEMTGCGAKMTGLTFRMGGNWLAEDLSLVGSVTKKCRR